MESTYRSAAEKSKSNQHTYIYLPVLAVYACQTYKQLLHIFPSMDVLIFSLPEVESM